MVADPSAGGATADGAGVVRVAGTVPPVAHAHPGSGRRAPSASQQAYGDTAGEVSLGAELGAGRRAIDLLAVIKPTFLPGFRRAVDALAPGAALELATHIVSIVKSAQHVRDQLRDATKHGAGAAMVSVPDGSLTDTPDAATARFAEAKALEAALTLELSTLTAELAIQLGPQYFRGRNVLGRDTAPVLGKDPVGQLANEAGATVELIATITQVQQATGADAAQCPILDDAQRQQVVALVEPWKGRPVNMAFLRAALTELGMWDAVATTTGTSGKTLEATANKSEAQGLITGALADVGEFDGDEAAKLLAETEEQQTLNDFADVSDRNAVTIFEKIAGAAPNARGGLIRQIEGMGRLNSLCAHLPWKAVEDLAGVIAPHDPEAAALLAPYYVGKGGGQSLHKTYMDQVDENLAEDSTLDTIQAFGWFFLDFVHNAFTGGFLHEYSAAYDAHEAGLITDNQFASAATKALGKAAAIIAVSAITGGVAGELATGVAAPLVGESAATLIGGGVGGFTAGVSGHFTGDVYDQMLNGKQGFDSVGDYMQSGALGGLMGVAVAGVSLAGAAYLPKSAMRTADLYAQRYPTMMRALESVRRVGVGQGTRVKVTVKQLLDMIDSGMGGPGGPTAFAVEGVGDMRYLPPETEVTATLRPLDDLNRPMQMSGSGKTTGGGGGDDPTGGKQPTTGGKDDPTPATPTPVDEPATTRVIAIDKVEVEPTAQVSVDPATWEANLEATLTPDQAKRYGTWSQGETAETMQGRLGENADVARARLDGLALPEDLAALRARLAGDARAAFDAKYRMIVKDPHNPAAPSIAQFRKFVASVMKDAADPAVAFGEVAKQLGGHAQLEQIAAQQSYPRAWDVFDPATNAAFAERLEAFRGNDSKAPTFKGGGEGQVFAEGKAPGVGLKRWYHKAIGKMPESIKRLQNVRTAVEADPRLAEHVEVVRIHEQGSDWMLRDVDMESVPLGTAGGRAEHAKRAAIEALEARAPTLNDAEKILLFKLKQGSDNLHWSDTYGKILVIDML